MFLIVYPYTSILKYTIVYYNSIIGRYILIVIFIKSIVVLWYIFRVQVREGFLETDTLFWSKNVCDRI